MTPRTLSRVVDKQQTEARLITQVKIALAPKYLWKAPSSPIVTAGELQWEAPT